MDIRWAIAICGLILGVGPAVVFRINEHTNYFQKWSEEKKFKWGIIGGLVEVFLAMLLGALVFAHFCNCC